MKNHLDRYYNKNPGFIVFIGDNNVCMKNERSNITYTHSIMFICDTHRQCVTEKTQEIVYI